MKMKRILRSLVALLALAAANAHADYRVIPYGQSYVFDFTLRNASASAFTSGLTLVSGECKISKNGGSDANCATLPTAISSTNKYLFTLSATEAQASRITITLSDSTGTAYFGREFAFDTCGASAARFPTCPDAPQELLASGTCDAYSTNLLCNYASLTQADGYWAIGVKIQVGSQPARCVQRFTNTTHRLEWQPALPATSMNQPFALFADASCPKY